MSFRKFEEISTPAEAEICTEFEEISTSVKTEICTATMAEKTIDFGVCNLKTFPAKEQFRTPLRNQLKEEEQCLLDNIWNLQTSNAANPKKVATLNALAAYLHTGRQIGKKPFVCYNLYTGPRAGVYLDWEEMALLIEEIKLMPRYGTPLYKGFFDIQEAINSVIKTCGNEIVISPRVLKYQEYLKHLETFGDQEFLNEIQNNNPRLKGKEISLRPQKSFKDSVASSSTKEQAEKPIKFVNLGKPTINSQPKPSNEEIGLNTFILLQDVLAQICNNKMTHNGLSSEWSCVYNHYKSCTSNFNSCPENQEGECFCQLDSAIRKARISIPNFKTFKHKDYVVSISNLLRHGLLSSINFPPLYEFTSYLPSFLADTLETISPEIPQQGKMEINSLYPDFQNKNPAYHVIWIYFKDFDDEYEEFQTQNPEQKNLALEDLSQQIEIARAKFIAENFGWSKTKVIDKNLLREDGKGKIYCQSDTARNFFFPFDVQHSRPKLVEAYRRNISSWSKRPGSSGSSQMDM